MSLSLNSKEILSFGNRIGYIADAALSGAYPYGGVGFNTEELLGIHNPDIVMMESARGIRFQYDKDSKKIKAFGPAPLVVIDETHTPDETTGLVTLDYPAAFIMNVAQSGGQNLAMRSTGLAIADMSANQCCLAAQMAKGVRTQLTCGIGIAADQLAGDGAFTGGTTNWTFNATPWTYGTNNLVKDADGANPLTHDNFVPVPGKTYKVCFSISGWSVGTVTPSLGGVNGTAVGEDGDFVQYITASTNGALTFTPTTTSRFTIDSVTVNIYEVKVTYVTQAWKDVWDNLVQDEAVTLATGANDLANKVLAMMYVDQITATAAALTMVDEDDTAASGEVEVAFNVATGQLTANAAQNAKAAKVTYVKVPDSGFLKDRLAHNETATKAGGDPYTNTFDYPILLWGYCGCAPVNTGTTQVLVDFTATPEAGEGVLDWFNPGIRGAGAPAAGSVIGVKSNVTLTGAYVWGRLDEIPNRQDLELRDGFDLSEITSLRMLVIGA